MPKKKAPDRMAPMALGAEEISAVAPIRPLSYEQRVHLSQIFADPVFKQAWQNAQAAKPNHFPLGLETALGAQIGNNRLHQQQGWELFRVALLRQVMDPPAAKPKVQDNYPDSGTREAELKARLGTTITTTISPNSP